MTRLRLRLRDPAAVDEAGLRAAGAAGVLRRADGEVHVVIGAGRADRSRARWKRWCNETGLPSCRGGRRGCSSSS